jgi:hypothetical protein
MAERLFVLCEPLCFLVNRFGKTQAKLLKTVIFDFYKPEDITGAKCQLLNDATQLMTTDSLPHIPNRRDRDTRIMLEIDDMFVILNCLDEKKKLNCLPRYVAESPDNMPSARFFDGDMKLLQIWLEKIEGKIDHFGSSMDAIVAQIRTIGQRTPSHGPEVRTTTAPQPSHGQPGQPNVINCTQSTSHVNNTRTVNDQNVNKQSTWAVRTSTPMHRSSTTTTDNDCDSHSEFTEVNYSKKRRLIKSKSGQLNKEPTPASVKSTARSGPLIIGKKSVPLTSSTSPTNTTSKIVAAKSFIEKSVFCVDNLHTAVTIENLQDFVTNSLHIEVVSCFETKPRRRRSDPLTLDHKAFRLCINRADRDRLLDESKWPVYVSISDWFFKSREPATLPLPQQQQQQQQPDKTQRYDLLSMDEARQNEAIEQAIADGIFDDHEDDVLEVTIQSVDMAIGKQKEVDSNLNIDDGV